MAKSKWEKLSKAFSLMLKGIDNYIDINDPSKKYNRIQIKFLCPSLKNPYVLQSITSLMLSRPTHVLSLEN